MVTIKDVAEHAGVSIATVSRVLNANHLVSDELRERVLHAMSELGYQPNVLARSLRMGETHTIGVILPDNANPFFAEVTRGIEDTSFEHGYSVILCNSDSNLQKELFYSNVLAEKQIDGIIFLAAGASADNLHTLQEHGVLVVVVDREIPDVTADSVLTRNEQGGWMATRHLIELGHRRVGCIAGPSDVTPSAERVTGYRLALQAADIPVDEQLILRGDFQCESGHRAAQEFLALDDPPTAIFACNDMMAIGAISTAVELGLKIPADLSIVGYDDVSLASYANPPLTTITQPKYEMGVLAAEMLLERVRNPAMPPRRHILDTGLVVRKSTTSIITENQENRLVLERAYDNVSFSDEPQETSILAK